MPTEKPGEVLREFRKQYRRGMSQLVFGEEVIGWGENIQRRFEDGSKVFTHEDLDEMVKKGCIKKGSLWYLRFEIAMVGLPWPVEQESEQVSPPEEPISAKEVLGRVSAAQVLVQVRMVLDEIDEGNLDFLYDISREEMEASIHQAILHSMYMAGLLTEGGDADENKQETKETLSFVYDLVFKILVSLARDTHDIVNDIYKCTRYLRSCDPATPEYAEVLEILKYKTDLAEQWQKHELVLLKAAAKLKGKTDIYEIVSRALERKDAFDPTRFGIA